ncbi:MAG: hypothetical protein ACI4OR_04325 [Alphaproteobacteria bacterium]
MTEPIFKAPLPPSGSGFTPPQPKEPEEQASAPAPEDPKQKILPYLWYVLGGTFAMGLLLGVIMVGGESAPPQPECPFQYVRNPDIQGRFPLCGRVSRSEACILYMMNITPYDKSVEDFYPDVLRQTERPINSISIENPVYSKYVIPSGAFAQIKIPSRR